VIPELTYLIASHMLIPVRELGIEVPPNAGPQAHLEAGAERRLEGVGCRRLFGTVSRSRRDASHELHRRDDENTLIRLQGEEVAIS